jgi:hypothetical protein
MHQTKDELWKVVGVGLLLAAILTVGFALYLPPGVDWQATFRPAVRSWQAPYEGSLFTNPPWALLLLPHGLLSLSLSNAINLTLNFVVLALVVRRFGGGPVALALVFTSPFILDLARTNNIDWIPALALLVPPAWGLLLLSVKPQAIGMVALIWWKQQGYALRMVIPTVVAVVLSFVVYGLWVTRAEGLQGGTGLWNIAPFPFGLPLGAYLFYRAWHHTDPDDSIALAAVSTMFLTPYVAPYSLNVLMALGASRFKRQAIIVWVVCWVFVIYTIRRNAILFGV